jgi:hypothetical protein
MLAVALAAVAVLQSWEPLGSRRVSFAVDHDVIEVGAREGTFNAIRIEVDGGTLEMYNIVLTFGNGDTWSPNTRVVFRPGSWSRLIDVPGPARFIRKIEFFYRSRLRRGQATVRVFGRSAGALGVVTPPRDAPPAESPAPTDLATPAGSWDHIGMRPVDFRVDHDAITAASEGMFRAIRIDVEGGDLEMFDVKITFGNGEAFSPNTRLYFREGTRSRVIDLPGDARIVRRIDFFYRSALFTGQGRAIVHVYGRR